MSARRDEILLIAAEIFAEKGFSATTMRDIADAAGMLPGSLYHYFESKEAMVDEIVLTFVEEAAAKYAGIAEAIDDPLEALQELIRAAFGIIVTQRAAYTVAHNESHYLLQFKPFAHLRTGFRAIDATWMSVLQRGIDAGVFKADLDVQFIYLLVREAVWVSARLVTRNRQYKVDDLSDAYVAFVLDGIRVTGAASPRRTPRPSG